MATKTVTIIRHSLALPATEGQSDTERRLSPEGMALAARRRESLENPTFDLGICSARLRTHQTMQIVGGTIPESTIIANLFDQDTPEQDTMFGDWYNRVGNKGLADYIADSSVEELSLLVSFGGSRWQLILEAMQRHPEATRILVVGHGVFSPAIVHAACLPVEYPCLLDEAWPECGGVTLFLEDDTIVGLTPLPRLE